MNRKQHPRRLTPSAVQSPDLSADASRPGEKDFPDDYDPALDSESDGFAERPNKTAGKRETDMLRELARRLAAMPDGKLATLALSERARDAIAEYQRIRPSAHGGKKRQLQLLIKVMRDEDTDQILDQLGDDQHKTRATSLEYQGLIDTRSKILDSDDAIEAFIIEHGLDNEFRTLARMARRELAAGRKHTAQRALMRALQKLFSREGRQ
ncbi:MAG: ribosome biogenesis factor YjgA [Burkholderiaceae bacterium]